LFQKTWNWDLLTSGIITGVIVIVIAIVSAWFTEETFMKKLNYVEKD
jgi:hypothetical protein